MSEELEALELEIGSESQQMLRDLRAGVRDRRFMAKSKALAKRMGLDGDVVMDQFIPTTGLPPWNTIAVGGDGAVCVPANSAAAKQIAASWLDESKRALADSLKIDWAALTEFMEALIPMIAEMMAMCGA